MNFISVNGLTQEELFKVMEQSPLGFSAENGGVQYLGREIYLAGGKLLVQQVDKIEQTDRTQDHQHLSIPRELKQRLASSKADALQKMAKQLLADDKNVAFEKAPTDELKCAVVLELIRDENHRTVLGLIIKIQSLPEPYQYQALLLLSGLRKKAIDVRIIGNLDRYNLTPAHKFNVIKAWFQRPESSDPSLNFQNKRLLLIPSRKTTLKSDFELIHKLISETSPKLVDGLTSLIEKNYSLFASKVRADGTLHESDQMVFDKFANNLLYFAAACSNIEDTEDVNELTSYIIRLFQDDKVQGTDNDNIARTLANLSTQSSLNYSNYIDSAAQVLRKLSTDDLDDCEFKQLLDSSSIPLLESNQTLQPYLSSLITTIENEAPELSGVVKQAIDTVVEKTDDIRKPSHLFTPNERQSIRKKFHLLLLVIAAYKNSQNTMDTTNLAPLVKAVISHKNKRDIPYLIKGIVHLGMSSDEVQHILCQSNSKGGSNLVLAPLGLLGVLKKSAITVVQLNQVCLNLQKHAAIRKKLKDSKVLHQWLVTLEKLETYTPLNEDSIGQALLTITHEKEKALLDKLAEIEVAITDYGINPFQEESEAVTKDLINKISERESTTLTDKSLNKDQQRELWLLKQRYSFLYQIYHREISTASGVFSEKVRAELLYLIDQFIEVSISNTFVENRQSPKNNPHLESIYKQRPEFRKGWNANFKDFSLNIRNQLKNKETLQLTEDPWDLFVSGYEVGTCQSPNALAAMNCSLMSYVMDGRNAMIVKKNKNGGITGRAILRLILDEGHNPVLFLEPTYTNGHCAASKTDKVIFMDAAKEIAKQMKLPLYHQTHSSTKDNETLILLEGKAPYDYFDGSGGITHRGEKISISCTKVDLKSEV